MKKIFLDTNIIIDFLGKRGTFYEPIAKILTLADRKQLQVFTSANAIVNAYYILSRTEAKEKVLDKIRRLKVICMISPLNEAVVMKAIYSDFKDFEDAIQYHSAMAQECDTIITRNESDFLKSEIPIMNADVFLKKWCAKLLE